jgi:multidrug efflux pump subunit AcrA (membrane-fusion protein)
MFDRRERVRLSGSTGRRHGASSASTSARLVLTAALAAGGAAGAAGCKPSGQQAHAAAMQRPPAAVVVTRAVAQDVPIYIEQIGKTSAINSVVIQPQVDGKITEVHFKDGSDVKKGQLLFTIDPRPFEAALAQAQATRQENQAKLKYAQDEFKRVEDIRQTGAVSIQEFETKRNAVAVAEAPVA